MVLTYLLLEMVALMCMFHKVHNIKIMNFIYLTIKYHFLCHKVHLSDQDLHNKAFQYMPILF